MKAPTTLAGLKKALRALGGSRCYIAAGVDECERHMPGRCSTSVYWMAMVAIFDDDECQHEIVQASASVCSSASDAYLKVRAKLRDELERKARQRRIDRDALRLSAPAKVIDVTPVALLEDLRT